MIVEHLELLYRMEAQESQDNGSNPFRASRAGHCVAAMARDKLGMKGELLTPRRVAVFKHGTLLHDALTNDLRIALGDKFMHPADFGDLTVDIEGATVSLHPDGGYQLPDGRIAVVEIKSMADFSFDEAREGNIDRAYLCQAWVYYVATGFDLVIFIAYRKETSHMVEIVFDRSAAAPIVTQRLGGDALALVREDPLELTEIITPFDLSVETEVREKYWMLMNVETERDIPPGVNAVGPELVKVQGKEKAVALQERYGAPIEIKGGGWHTFVTGRQIANFPCSYCQHIKACLGATLELKGNSPVWVIGRAPIDEGPEA